MRIVSIEPEGGFSPPGNIVARLDVWVDRVKLKGLVLKRNSMGDYRVYPPNLRGRAVADLDPKLAAEITEAALSAITGGRSPNGLERD